VWKTPRIDGEQTALFQSDGGGRVDLVGEEHRLGEHLTGPDQPHHVLADATAAAAELHGSFHEQENGFSRLSLGIQRIPRPQPAQRDERHQAGQGILTETAKQRTRLQSGPHIRFGGERGNFVDHRAHWHTRHQGHICV
jgi:hypothetical protein